MSAFPRSALPCFHLTLSFQVGEDLFWLKGRCGSDPVLSLSHNLSRNFSPNLASKSPISPTGFLRNETFCINASSALSVADLDHLFPLLFLSKESDLRTSGFFFFFFSRVQRCSSLVIRERRCSLLVQSLPPSAEGSENLSLIHAGSPL